MKAKSFVENGDNDDDLKWDFDESVGYTTIDIDGFPYKVLSQNPKGIQHIVANKLHKLRGVTNRIANNIDKRAKGPGIDIFKHIHKDKGKRSNFLLSEIKPSTGFSGLNKPKDRILTNDVFVGPDENIRAQWRDIFLTINPRTQNITPEEMELLIHELAHTGANHVRWRPDDHNEDFTSFEKLLWSVLNDI